MILCTECRQPYPVAFQPVANREPHPDSSSETACDARLASCRCGEVRSPAPFALHTVLPPEVVRLLVQPGGGPSPCPICAFVGGGCCKADGTPLPPVPAPLSATALLTASAVRACSDTESTGLSSPGAPWHRLASGEALPGGSAAADASSPSRTGRRRRHQQSAAAAKRQSPASRTHPPRLRRVSWDPMAVALNGSGYGQKAARGGTVALLQTRTATPLRLSGVAPKRRAYQLIIPTCSIHTSGQI